MVKKDSLRLNPAKPPTDGDGNVIGNAILLSLSSNESKDVVSRLEFVRLKLHQLLYEAGETIKSGYFINSGLMSVLVVQPDGKTVEVGLIGKVDLDEPRPDSIGPPSAHTRIPSTDVGDETLQRDGVRWNFAESGTDFLYQGKRHDFGPAQTRGGGVRLLWHCAATATGLGSRD